MRSEIDGYILTGGGSRRMGEAKSRIVLHGRTFAQRVADAITPNARRVFTVGEPVLYPDVENVSDSSSTGRSSMRGLVAALRHASTDWIIVAACDMPFVTEQMFALLIDELDEANGAVIPLSADKMPQPLCSLYNVAASYEICEAALGKGDLRLSRSLPFLNAKYVEHSIFARLPGSEHFFENINTPDDFAAALAIAADLH